MSNYFDNLMRNFTDEELLYLSKLCTRNEQREYFTRLGNLNLINKAVNFGLFVINKPVIDENRYWTVDPTEDGMYFFDNYLIDYLQDLETENGHL